MNRSPRHRLGDREQRKWNGQIPRQCLGYLSATIGVRQVKPAHVLKIASRKSAAEVGRQALRQFLKQLSRQGQQIAKPQDLLKEPYVLEFLGLEERASYSESELEAAIVDHVERFLLELGKRFLFEARQKRFTFDEEHFFVDLVLYNRLLHCYVLVDLKIGKLTHQDLGQMQM